MRRLLRRISCRLPSVRIGQRDARRGAGRTCRPGYGGSRAHARDGRFGSALHRTRRADRREGALLSVRVPSVAVPGFCALRRTRHRRGCLRPCALASRPPSAL